MSFVLFLLFVQVIVGESVEKDVWEQFKKWAAAMRAAEYQDDYEIISNMHAEAQIRLSKELPRFLKNLVPTKGLSIYTKTSFMWLLVVTKNTLMKNVAGSWFPSCP